MQTLKRDFLKKTKHGFVRLCHGATDIKPLLLATHKIHHNAWNYFSVFHLFTLCKSVDFRYFYYSYRIVATLQASRHQNHEHPHAAIRPHGHEPNGPWKPGPTGTWSAPHASRPNAHPTVSRESRQHIQSEIPDRATSRFALPGPENSGSDVASERPGRHVQGHRSTRSSFQQKHGGVLLDLRSDRAASENSRRVPRSEFQFRQVHAGAGDTHQDGEHRRRSGGSELPAVLDDCKDASSVHQGYL